MPTYQLSTHAALDAIKAVRDCGQIMGGVQARSYALPEQAAGAFGLLEHADLYHAIPAAEAIAVLAAVIHADMAYGCELVPLALAQALARDFVLSVPQLATRYFTNGTFGQNQARPSSSVGASWSPATDATFDTGVLVLGAHMTACLWFADED